MKLMPCGPIVSWGFCGSQLLSADQNLIYNLIAGNAHKPLEMVQKAGHCERIFAPSVGFVCVLTECITNHPRAVPGTLMPVLILTSCVLNAIRADI